MRLSDAIRLGAMLKPQGTGSLMQGGHTCALGAALDAVGVFAAGGGFVGMYAVDLRWPWIGIQGRRSCPACSVSTPTICCGSVAACVIHLNDDHRWTREAIADWVAQQEDALGIIDDGQQATVPTPEADHATV